MSDETLVAKGRKEPLEGLKAQGRYTAKLIEENPKVNEFGWSAAQTTELQAALNVISTSEASRSEAEDTSLSATAKQEAAIDAAKADIQSVRNVLPIAVRRAKQAGVAVQEKMFVSGSLGRSVSAIASYLTNVIPSVKLIDAQLQPLVKFTASDRLTQRRVELERADKVQEAAVKGTPTHTASIAEAKGKVLQLVEDVNRIAKNAYAGQAEVVGKFNKDLLLRARRERAKKDEPGK